MPKYLALRVQSKSGRFPLSDLSPDSTLLELQTVLEEKAKLPPNAQKILLGYPPREIDSYDPQCTLSSLHICSGETLIVQELSPSQARREKALAGGKAEERAGNRSVTSPSVSVSAPLNHPMGALMTCVAPYVPGGLKRRVVPADNSCLFRSVSILLYNSADSGEELREFAAAIILSNPEKYTTALLGRSNQDYVQWLRKKESWGGAIELKVFSEHYKLELDVVDIQTQRIDRFGEDCGYTTRAFLLYDGIHYDPLVWESRGVASSQGVFLLEDESVMIDALQIAAQAKKARQFTDMAGFNLRCLVCGQALRGQGDAMTHAQKTGHSNFGEV